MKKDYKDACPKCNSTNVTYYPLGYYSDYKCNECKHKFNDNEVLKVKNKSNAKDEDYQLTNF